MKGKFLLLDPSWFLRDGAWMSFVIVTAARGEVNLYLDLEQIFAFFPPFIISNQKHFN
jgi:hypothetical protein